jgi:hypothetical protein
MRCQTEGLTVWFVRRVGMYAKVGGEAWLGVMRRRVYASGMESPWLCLFRFCCSTGKSGVVAGPL